MHDPPPSPLDFIARLAVLVPRPRVNLTRFHGVFAPNSKHRARVTPGGRGSGARRAATEDREEPTPAERRASMTRAQRLQRIFGIDIETCERCGGLVKVIASIEAPVVIGQILSHLEKEGPGRVSPGCRERPPPGASPDRPG